MGLNKTCAHKKAHVIGSYPVWWCPDCGGVTRGNVWQLPSLKIDTRRLTPWEFFLLRVLRRECVWLKIDDHGDEVLRVVRSGHKVRRFSALLLLLPGGGTKWDDGLVSPDAWRPAP